MPITFYDQGKNIETDIKLEISNLEIKTNQ